MKVIRTRFAALVLVAICTAGLVVSLVLLFRPAATPAGAPANNTAAPLPVETPPPTPEEVKTYSVAADLPKYISIPAIGVNQARILHFGLLKNGEVATPTNTADAGWYTKSAKPGQAGAMFVSGHLSSPTNNGLFHNLKKLRPGDKITIIGGDDTTYTYVVKRSQSYPATQVDMNAVLSPVAGAPGLNLMTCDGTYNKDTQSFSDRFVVFASLAD